MLPVMFACPWVPFTPPSSLVPVVTPLIRTVPLLGTAGASLSRLSRSMPSARAASAMKAVAARIRRMEMSPGGRAFQSSGSAACPGKRRGVNRRPIELTGHGASDIPAAPVQKTFYIHTFGCQMNEHDSARMGESLTRAGWIPTAAPESADLVLLNTCAIREKAEDKLYSALGRYRLLKSARGARIGVAGCVAQQEKEALLARAPYVDFVLGPDQLARVSDLAEQGGIETGWVPSEEYVFPQADPETSRGRVTAFVLAMKGCDNVCSFCVVPHTRGREVSRPYAEIVREVHALVGVGVREVTLIGQNVNSYAGGCSFAALIRRVAAVPGLARIRFTTSHPMDLSGELVECFRDVPQLMPHFHLPVQHGSDAVLARMRRRYSIAEYEARVGSLLEACPHVALTSDIICGFPGETEAEHAQTLALLRRVPYDNLFSFLYSERPATAASLKLEQQRSPAVT